MLVSISIYLPPLAYKQLRIHAETCSHCANESQAAGHLIRLGYRYLENAHRSPEERLKGTGVVGPCMEE